MDQIGDWPYAELSFDAQGVRLGQGSLAPEGTTDLIVISHGWHMQAQPAQVLYTSLLKKVSDLTKGASRKVAVVGVFWPSDEFNTDLSHEVAPVTSGGGGASIGGGGGDLSVDILRRRAATVGGFLGDNPQAMADAAELAARGGAKADAFVDRLRALIKPAAAQDPQDVLDHAALLSKKPGEDLLQTWARPFPAVAAPKVSGGGAAFSPGSNPLQTLFFGARSAVVTALNAASYFEMKKRAGAVGEALGVLLQTSFPASTRIHLIGHSFGARLVTAAANEFDSYPAQSLTLLQGAFSHNALGINVPTVGDGFYRGVIAHKRVAGPISITHTWNDTAVGFWYPLASRASNDVSAAFINTSPTFGGQQDPHGGMGSNGALALGPNEGANTPYGGDGDPGLKGGGFVNSLRCDFIPEHVFVDGPGCAQLVAAVLATP